MYLLDGASVSRPHHCQPQWFASSQSVGSRLGNHNAAPHCYCRLVLFLVTLYSTIQSGSRHGDFCRQLQQSLVIAYGLDSPDILGIMSTNSPSFHCMQHMPVRLPIASISTYSIFRTPSMSDVHLPVEHTRLTKSRSTYKIELDLSALFSNFCTTVLNLLI